MIDLRSPAESPKSVFAHEHVTCTLDAGGDAPQLTSKESHRKRDSQVDRRELLRTRNPTLPGGTPSGSAAAMGCPRSVKPPLEPRGPQLSNTKNNEGRGSKNEGGTRRR